MSQAASASGACADPDCPHEPDALMGASGPGNESRATVLEPPTGFIGLGRDRPHVVPCEEERESMEYRGGVEQRQMVQAICRPFAGEGGDYHVAKRRPLTG